MNIVKQIEKALEKLPKKSMANEEREYVQRYLGTNKRYLGAKTKEMLQVAKDAAHEQDELGIDEIVTLLDRLFSADTFEEHAIGGKMFTLLRPEKRWLIPLSDLTRWLSNSHGWVEIDVICQSSFSGKEVVEHWDTWQPMIKKYRKSQNISLRRAALVLQTRSVREVNDIIMRRLAFDTVELLKHEKEGLITKAVSWLLRSLTFQNKEEVKRYLLSQESTLPRIAFRETMRKIETGKK